MNRILGADISKGYITLFDGLRFHVWVEPGVKPPTYKGGKLAGQPVASATIHGKKYEVITHLYGRRRSKKADKEHIERLRSIVEGATVIMEHTGSYSVRYGILLSQLGATVYVVHGQTFRKYTRMNNGGKDDFSDAYFLRRYYLDNHKVREFNAKMHQCRTLARQYRQIEKVKTQVINRFKQDLITMEPMNFDYTLPAKQIYRKIEQGKYDGIKGLEPLVRLLKNLLSEERLLKERMNEILNEILTDDERRVLESFFGQKTEVIFTLKAYYWDIGTFTNVEEFVSYMLMGGHQEVSGRLSVKHIPEHPWERERELGRNINFKKTRVRREVKWILYRLWQSGQGNGTKVWKPLVNHIKWLSRQLNWPPANKIRRGQFTAFYDILLRLLYIGLKQNLTLPEVLKLQISRYERELTKNKRDTEREIIKARMKTYMDMLDILDLTK